MMNRLGNCKNYHQGSYKKVLCVCSAGLLRSPTTAWVLSNEPYNYNTRSVGLEEEFALIPIDIVHIEWADEIVCMDKSQKTRLEALVKECGLGKPIISLDIPDSFPYRSPKLIELIKERYPIK